MVLNDWQRGRIPYFVKPADSPASEQSNDNRVEVNISIVEGDGSVPAKERKDQPFSVIQNLDGIRYKPDFSDPCNFPLGRGGRSEECGRMSDEETAVGEAMDANSGNLSNSERSISELLVNQRRLRN